MKPLFVYGILQFPEILVALLGHTVRMEAATLHGYERCRKPLRNGIMRGPGIIASQDAAVSGFLLLDLSSEDLTTIDILEGKYDRTPITVICDGKHTSAEVYFPTDTSDYIHEPWDPDAFKKLGLQYYINVRIPEILQTES